MHYVMVLSAVIMTLFLFYIDEGYYDFRWMQDGGNWLAFIIYVVILFAAQEFLYYIISKVFRSPVPKVVIIIAGLILGIWTCFQIFTAL